MTAARPNTLRNRALKNRLAKPNARALIVPHGTAVPYLVWINRPDWRPMPIRMDARAIEASLLLRPLYDDDSATLADFGNDPSIARMVGRMPYPYLRRDAEGFVRRLQAPGAEKVFAIETDGGFAGCIGAIPLGPRLAEAGYWLTKAARGNGVATAALKALSIYAGPRIGIDRLVAGHFDDNPASARVLTKAGFLVTGDSEQRYSLGRGERVTCHVMSLDLEGRNREKRP